MTSTDSFSSSINRTPPAWTDEDFAGADPSLAHALSGAIYVKGARPDPAGHQFCSDWGHPDADALRRFLEQNPDETNGRILQDRLAGTGLAGSHELSELALVRSQSVRLQQRSFSRSSTTQPTTGSPSLACRRKKGKRRTAPPTTESMPIRSWWVCSSRCRPPKRSSTFGASMA